jgi:hypothetical protein
MIIRKISVGPDYKGGAMHYLLGQEILGGAYTIHLISYNKDTESIMIWIQKSNRVYLWKEFKSTMPLSIEYDINFS